MKHKYRSIDAVGDSQQEQIEKLVYAAVENPVLTMVRLKWLPCEYGGPPDLSIHLCYRRPPDEQGMRDKLEAISQQFYLHIAMTMCQDEDWYHKPGGFTSYWDDEDDLCPY